MRLRCMQSELVFSLLFAGRDCLENYENYRQLQYLESIGKLLNDYFIAVLFTLYTIAKLQPTTAKQRVMGLLHVSKLNYS